MTLRNRIVSWVSDRLVRHAVLVAAGVLLAGGFFIAHVPSVAMRADTEDFLLPNDPSYLLQRRLEKIFPRTNFILIAFGADDIFRPEPLGVLARITRSMQEIEGVEDVVSLAKVDRITGTASDFIVEPLMKQVPETPAGLALLRQRALSDPLYVPHLISKDGKTAAALVFIQEKSQEDRARIVGDIRARLAPLEKEGWSFRLTGWPVTSLQMGKYMLNDISRYIPITVLAVLLALWLIFRNFRLMVLASLGILATLLATAGLLAFTHTPFNNASVAVIPIVISLALTDIVHLFGHLERRVLDEAGGNERKALVHILRVILFPCFLTSLNTGIGFASLSWNRIPAVRSFGWLAAAGMVFEFLFTFGLIAPMLLAFRPETIYMRPKRRGGLIVGFVETVHRFVARRAPLVFLGCLGIMAWAVWQSRHLAVETNMVQYFRASTDYRQELEYVRDRLAGVNTMDIDAEASERDGLREPEVLAWMDRLQRRISQVPGVDAAISSTDFFKRMNQAFHGDDPAYYQVPASRKLVDQYLLLYSGRDLEQYMTSDFQWGRIRLRLGEDSSRATAIIMQRIQQFVEQEPPPAGVRIHYTGMAVNLVKTSQTMVGDQVMNIVSAVVSIWLVMVLVLRSIPLALLFLVPNLFPVLVNFGVMGQFHIPLNIGTALTAATAFGIIVDDTVHFFARLQEVRTGKVPFKKAVEEVTREKGPASLSSALILAAGFGVITMGQFLPVVYFGALTVFILAIGIFGDQVFLKSIFYLGEGRAARRTA